MYRKELPVGERIPTESVVLENCADGIEPTVSYDQLSEQYDSASDEKNYQLAEDPEEASEVELHKLSETPVKFLSKTIRTRSGRAVTLSHRALSSY